MDFDIIITCPMCGNTEIITVDFYDYIRYEKGELVQNAFPYLSATEREQTISGLCPTCQKDIFREL